MNRYDVVIIGGGAAGLSAALVLARARRRVLVVDAGSPRNAPAVHLHDYLSRDGIPPAELLASGRDEVTRYGGEVIAVTATDIVPGGRVGFWVLLAGGRRISARRLLVTTGLRDELPAIPGLRDRWARDVLHCVVEGPSNILSLMMRTGYVLCEWLDGGVVPRDVLFVPPRFVPNSALLVGLGTEMNADGWVAADTTGRTSVAGVWAAGNVVDPRAQVITAAGAGSAAAIALNADLVEDDVRAAVRDLDHGLLPGPNQNTRQKEKS